MNDADSPFKSRPGLARVWRAFTYSWAGLRAAFLHEAAFRQELALGVPALVLVPFVAPGRVEGLLMACSVLLVWIVELLNTGLEALADSVSVERHPLLGRAKDLGSAAVMGTIGLALLTWVLLLWPY
jgi:diacylglycerol kinase (ATP)